MKRNSHICLYFLLLFFTIAALVPACKKDVITNSAPPAITSVRLYNPTPKDTLLSTGDSKTDPSWSIPAGRYVVIIGQNLQNATKITFDGVPTSFNPTLFAPGSAVVPIPNIQFSTVDTTKLYTVEYTTPAGSTSFSFKLGPAAPTMTAISDVFANPGDSVFVYGSDLVLVQSFQYGGTKITSFKYNTWGTALGFLMPATTTTDQVLLTTKSGSASLKIVATPTITGVSNENASTGDSVYVYGTYLKNITAFTFAGTTINSFTSSASGNSVGFVLPALTQSGPVSITTKFGSAATLYKVNDIATGSISNWEWSGNFNWQWWGGATLTSGDPTSGWPPYNADFPGNSSLYMVLKRPVLTPGEGNTWSDYAIRMNSAQWVPTANLNDPVDNWAFKFEVSVPQGWKGGSIVIFNDQGGTPVARWEPWQISATKTAAYSTKKWVTVTIPLSSFRANDTVLGEGKGAPITKITDITGPTGNTACTMYLHNYATTATSTGFNGAFDNIRVVKIK
jgi:hypothetical protein